jgi:DNA-binding HxlR family transcriptional regulator
LASRTDVEHGADIEALDALKAANDEFLDLAEQIPESHTNCPVGHATALLGDRWSIMIVREALGGANRYQEFREQLSISDHTLTRRLGHLQEIGVLSRNEEAPTQYQLTEAGQDLARVLAVLGDWAMKWLPVELPLRSIAEPVVRAAEQLGIDIPDMSLNGLFRF